MDESIERKFVAQLVSDENLQTRLSACKTQEEAYNVVKAEGYDVEFSDFVDGMDRLNDFVQKVKQISESTEELSESDLEIVAGGRSSAGEQWRDAAVCMAIEVAVSVAAS